MTTDENETAQDLDVLNANLARVEELSQRLVAALAQKQPPRAGLQGPGQDLYMRAATAYMSEMMSNPAKLVEQQVAYWGKSVSYTHLTLPTIYSV